MMVVRINFKTIMFALRSFFDAVCSVAVLRSANMIVLKFMRTAIIARCALYCLPYYLFCRFIARCRSSKKRGTLVLNGKYHRNNFPIALSSLVSQFHGRKNKPE